MRVAAIDIGTNSTRLLIADCAEPGMVSDLHRETSITRLGAGLNETGVLSRDGIDRVLSALAAYKKLIDRFKPACLRAVATSAVREAANAAAFLDEAGKLLGQRPETVSGAVEANLAYRGATANYTGQNGGGDFLVVDIGGGSTEIIRGDKKGPLRLVSLPLGCVRQTEMFLHDDPPTREQLDSAKNQIKAVLDDAVDPGEAPATALAVAGTPTTLAAIDLRLDEYDAERVHLYELTKEVIDRSLVELASLNLAARRRLAGLESDRADVIIAGVLILQAVVELFSLRKIVVSERDILDGIALSCAFP